MVNSQEVIERSFYSALLSTAVKLGYTIDPMEFLPASIENQKKYEEAIKALPNKPFISIFGTGNNQSKGQKVTPRIVVNAKGFFPGDIGMPKQLIEREEGIGFTASEFPYETINQYIDVHLVANNQEDLRLLHQIMFWSLPQRGYIKPYNEDSFLFSGNIFLELVNFYDIPNNSEGILEKNYEFIVYDCLLGDKVEKADIVPITDISVILDTYGYELIHVPEK